MTEVSAKITLLGLDSENEARVRSLLKGSKYTITVAPVAYIQSLQSVPGIVLLDGSLMLDPVFRERLDARRDDGAIMLLILCSPEEEEACLEACKTFGCEVVTSDRMFRLIPALQKMQHAATVRLYWQQSEKQLEESLARYKAMIEAFDGFIYICTRDYRIEFMNHKFIERTGYDATGELCYKALHGLDDMCPWCVNDRVFSGETVKWETESPKDNRWYHIVNTPIRYPDGRVLKMAMIEDVTERRHTEMELSDSNVRFHRLIHAAYDGIVIHDQGEIIEVNAQAAKMFRVDREQCIGRNALQFIAPEERERVSRFIFEQHERPYESTGIRSDGAVFPLELVGTQIPYHGREVRVVALRDISERKKAEQDRRAMDLQVAEAREREVMERTNRLASMGLLAAGVAHEVNNPLQGMKSHLNSIRRAVPDDFSKMSSLDMVDKGIDSIAAIVRQLLSLHQGEASVSNQAVCVESINFVIQLVREQFRRRSIRIVKQKGCEPVVLTISSKDLIQVLLNLFINAQDAMPDGGTLFLSVHDKGNHIQIVLKDTGPGIPNNIIGRIFTPFFTTKGTRGTGLGLSVVESIVHQAGGKIEVRSEANQGAVFILSLPKAESGAYEKADSSC